MRTALIDLDGMLHIIANVQWSAGNRTDFEQVKDHVRRFYASIRKGSECTHSLSFYQDSGHENFRKMLLPRYKEKRIPTEQVKLFKPVIIEAFKEFGAIGLKHIESDDAICVLAPMVGYDKIVVVSSDKDMVQVPTTHYNPFKKGTKAKPLRADSPERWRNVDRFEAYRFLWQQVLSGDGGDMPLDICGIEGIGSVKASEMLDNDDTYSEIIQREYTKKYGDAGFARANITYMMVRLLNGTKADGYAGEHAKLEIQMLKDTFTDYVTDIQDDVAALFGIKPTKGSDLFNN